MKHTYTIRDKAEVTDVRGETCTKDLHRFHGAGLNPGLNNYEEELGSIGRFLGPDPINLEFVYDEKADALYAQTAYSFTRELTDRELEGLMDYTLELWKEHGLLHHTVEDPIEEFDLTIWDFSEQKTAWIVERQGKAPAPLSGVDVEF